MGGAVHGGVSSTLGGALGSRASARPPEEKQITGQGPSAPGRGGETPSSLRGIGFEKETQTLGKHQCPWVPRGTKSWSIHE